MTCYFDDFIIMSTPELADNTQQVIALMFDMLGWAFDKSGDKSDAFSSTVAALGVVFDFESPASGLLHVSNTDRRMQESMELMQDALQSKVLKHKHALVLRGRLAFCDAYIFGRVGKLALQTIMTHAYARPFVEEVSDYLYSAPSALLRRFKSAVPRQVSTEIVRTFHIYTDASFAEDRSGGLGGVLCNSNGDVISWFGVLLSADVVKQLMGSDQQVAIGELETLAVLLAVKIWSNALASTKTIFFIDNEGAKFSLIKGYFCVPLYLPSLLFDDFYLGRIFNTSMVQQSSVEFQCGGCAFERRGGRPPS